MLKIGISLIGLQILILTPAGLQIQLNLRRKSLARIYSSHTNWMPYTLNTPDTQLL